MWDCYHTSLWNVGNCFHEQGPEKIQTVELEFYFHGYKFKIKCRQMNFTITVSTKIKSFNQFFNQSFNSSINWLVGWKGWNGVVAGFSTIFKNVISLTLCWCVSCDGNVIWKVTHACLFFYNKKTYQLNVKHLLGLLNID